MSQSLGLPAVRVARGVRALEDLLLEDLGLLLPRTLEDLRGLSAPVLLVVSSSALRQHVLAQLMCREQRSVAGLRVLTLRGLALSILGGRGGEDYGSRQLVGLMIRRELRREPELGGTLVTSREGLAAVHATVSNLLDAGLTAESGEALQEQLLQLSAGAGGQAARARALVRVAARVQEQLEDLPAFVPGMLRRATERVAEDPGAALQARAVLVHGFSDATGLGTDLLESVLRHEGAVLYLDRPEDPAHPGEDEVGLAFARRFAERLAPGRLEQEPDWPEPLPVDYSCFRAVGRDAELREVARRIHVLTDAGAVPEKIAIVARSLGPWMTRLRVHFTRLGVPFSGAIDALDGPITQASRRAAQLARLLAMQGKVPAEAWVSLLGRLAPEEPDLDALSRADLRVALHALGVSRLSDLASVSERIGTRLRAGNLRLPIRHGLTVQEAREDGVGKPVATSRQVPGDRLMELTRRASALLDVFEAGDAEGTVAERTATLDALLREHLLWRSSQSGVDGVREGLAALAETLPPGLRVSDEEWLELVSTTLGELGRSPLGGVGGGVQVLSVVEARARSFEHLFVIGLNRDEFPRTIQDDPLLPDRLRSVLSAVLPDLPLARSGFDEERFLFAQLVSASPRVTLSWLISDEDGKPRAPSPLVERLRLAGAIDEGQLVGCEHSAPRVGLAHPERSASEATVLAGLFSSRAAWSDHLAELRSVEGDELGERDSARALAGFRAALMAEIDPDLGTREGQATRKRLGPFFGLLGERSGPLDPRSRTPAVTTLQAVSRCPWQAFLTKLLKLEVLPDPLLRLLGVERDFLGVVVHGALEDLVSGEDSIAQPLADARAAPIGSVVRPSPEDIEAALTRRLAIEAADRGLHHARVLEAVARRAGPMVACALDADWPSAGDSRYVIGAELKGSVCLPPPVGSVQFTADRVDLEGDRVRLVDYKTGTPISEAVRPKTRRTHLLRGVEDGSSLQPAAYAFAEGLQDAVGSLLFVKPDISDEFRVHEITSDDSEFRVAFEQAVGTLREAWDHGLFFPRLTSHDGTKEGPACKFCQVREACLRGETGAHLRLAEFATQEGPPGHGEDPESVLIRLWRMGPRSQGR